MQKALTCSLLCPTCRPVACGCTRPRLRWRARTAGCASSARHCGWQTRALHERTLTVTNGRPADCGELHEVGSTDAAVLSGLKRGGSSGRSVCHQRLKSVLMLLRTLTVQEKTKAKEHNAGLERGNKQGMNMLKVGTKRTGQT
jgi:hypothetical protein